MSVTEGPAIETLDGEGFEALLRDASVLARQDSGAASKLLQRIYDDAVRRGQPELVADCAYLRARVALNQGDPTAALELIDVARSSWIEAGELLRAARTDLGRMNVLDDLGRHADAIEVGQALLELLDDQIGDDDQARWIRAGALENLGVSHGYLGLHAAALAAHTEAEQTYRALGCDDEMIQPLANRGVELLEVGDAGAAIAALREAALGFDRLGDHLFVAKCLVYEARAQLQLGDYLACMAATRRAESLVEGQHTTTDFARVQLVRADTLTSLNLLDAALALYVELCELFAADGFRHDRAAAEFGRAIVLARLGRTEDSREAFELAATLYAAVGDECQAAFVNVARSELQSPNDARRLVAATIPTLRSGTHPAQLATALLRQAALEDKADAALVALDEVAQVLAEHDLPHLAWQERHQRGRMLAASGRPTEALQAYDEARAAVNSLRATLDRDYERLPFMAGRDQVIEDSIDLLLATDRVLEAFTIAEEARSRTLVETMSGRLQPTAVAHRPAELDALYNELLRAPRTSAVGLQRQLRRLEGDAAATSTLRREHPGTAGLQAGAVVTYQILGDEILAFVSTDSNVRVVRSLTNVSELQVLLGRLEAQWRRFDDLALAARQHSTLLVTVTEVLQQLHIRLVAPLDVLDVDSLVVVPHGPLANLAFGALHDGTCHLIERMPVTMAPSTTAASHALARAQARSQRRRLVVGVASSETPSVVDEVEAIAAHTGSSTLLGTDATVDAFFEAVGDHDIIHIASHGMSRPDNPLFSAVRFADRWLTAGEIAGAALDGQLVVLSACASGQQHRSGSASELDGLPRALLAAGAGAVAVNLWPVDDAASSSVMRRFHDHLNDESAPAALRRAQRQTMADLPHPYRWAPTVVIGAPTTREDMP